MESLEIDWEVDSSRPIDNTDRDRVVRRDIPLGLALKFRIEAKVSFILIYAVSKKGEAILQISYTAPCGVHIF